MSGPAPTVGSPATPRARMFRALMFLGLVLLLVLLFGRAMSRDLDPDEHQFVAPHA